MIMKTFQSPQKVFTIMEFRVLGGLT